MKKNIVLAVDPGKHNGIAGWEIVEGQQPVLLVEDLFCHINIDDMANFFKWVEDKYNILFLVVEDYFLMSKLAKQQSGSSMPAVRIIGQMEFWANHLGVELYKQRSNLLPTASGIAGITIPSNHAESHRYCAYVHGYFRMHHMGMAKSALVLKREKEQKNG